MNNSQVIKKLLADLGALYIYEYDGFVSCTTDINKHGWIASISVMCGKSYSVVVNYMGVDVYAFDNIAIDSIQSLLQYCILSPATVVKLLLSQNDKVVDSYTIYYNSTCNE